MQHLFVSLPAQKFADRYYFHVLATGYPNSKIGLPANL
jgi:hypothetical protein